MQCVGRKYSFFFSRRIIRLSDNENRCVERERISQLRVRFRAGELRDRAARLHPGLRSRSHSQRATVGLHRGRSDSLDRLSTKRPVARASGLARRRFSVLYRTGTFGFLLPRPFHIPSVQTGDDSNDAGLAAERHGQFRVGAIRSGRRRSTGHQLSRTVVRRSISHYLYAVRRAALLFH